MDREVQRAAKGLRDPLNWVGIGIALLLALMLWLLDWSGPYGPLEAREWLSANLLPDKHENLYVITSSPHWEFGVVKSCQRSVRDVGPVLRQRRPWVHKEDLLNCNDPYTPVTFEDEYVTLDRLAITFKKASHHYSVWECLKTTDGIVCK